MEIAALKPPTDPTILSLIDQLTQTHEAWCARRESAAALERLAGRTHAAMVAANAAGRIDEALALAWALDPLARGYFWDDPNSRHAIWNDLGALLHETGDLEQALVRLEWARAALPSGGGRYLLSADERDGATRRELRTLTNLISVHTDLGDLEAAVRLVERGQTLAQRLGDDLDDDQAGFLSAEANWLLGLDRIAEADERIAQLDAIETDDPVYGQQLARLSLSAANAFMGRRRYARAADAIRRAWARLDAARFGQDAADLKTAEADLHYKIAADDIGSPHWATAKALNQEAIALRAASPRLSPSAGCQEWGLEAQMALRERRLKAGRRDLAQALRLARTVWRRGATAIEELVLGCAAYDMAADRYPRVARRLLAMQARLEPQQPLHRRVLRRALPMLAEAYRRLAEPALAAKVLEDVLDLEAQFMDDAIAASWTPMDAVLARRVHEPLNAYVDALIAADPSDLVPRLFSRIASAKDLALRTLRSKRGGLSALKVSTLVDDLARKLPIDGAYVEFFIQWPRVAGDQRGEWGTPEVLAFTLESGDAHSLQLHRLGPLKKVKSWIDHLDDGDGLGGYRLWRLSRTLAPVLDACAARYVFIAPDGPLHAVPYAALRARGRRWVQDSALALVESVASVVDAPVEFLRPHNTAVVISAARIDPALEEPYAMLPHALEEAREVAAILGVTPIILEPDWSGRAKIDAVLRHPPSILHIAGHADVFRGPWPHPGFDAQRWGRLSGLDDDFDRSRLILGGFNRWANGDIDADRLGDVSLSAADLASLPLRSLRLLCLAVCFGGAGEPQVLESSASLAAGARVAGAGAVVAAPWGVPDRDTRALMQAFYAAYLQTGSAMVSLARAQQRLIRRRPKAWAGFVVWAGPDDLMRRP